MSRAARHDVLVAALLGALVPSLGCGGDRPRVTLAASASASAATVDPCADARAQRLRVPGLRAAGKLDRTLRVLRRANAQCPADASSTWGAELDALTALGRWSDVRALAAIVDGSAASSADAKDAARVGLARAAELDRTFDDTDAAKAPMRDAYKRASAKEAEGDLDGAYALYLDAWNLWRPNGQALLQAGLIAARTNRPTDAQKLFDRGIDELERARGTTVALDTPNGIGEPERGLRRVREREIAWSAAGRIAIAVGADVAILNQSLREIVRLSGHTGVVHAVAFSPDAKSVASAAEDGRLRVWDASTGANLRAWATEQGALYAVAWSPDGASLASGGHDGTIKTWALDADGATRTLSRPSGEIVTSLAFRTATEIVSGESPGMQVHLWDRSTGNATNAGCKGLTATSRDGKTVAAFNGLCDVETGRSIGRVPARTLFWGAAFAPDGQTLARSAPDGVELIDLATGAVKWTARVDAGGVAFSPDGQWLATIVGGSPTILDAATGAVVRAWETHAHCASHVALTADGAKVASSCDRAASSKPKANTVRLWTLDGSSASSRVAKPGVEVSSGQIAFAPDGAALAMPIDVMVPDQDRVPAAVRGERFPTLGLWHLDGSGRVDSIDSTAVSNVAFSPDGAFLGLAPAVRRWSVRERRDLQPFVEAGDGVSVAFSPDGRWIASRSARGETRIFDVSSGARVQTLTSTRAPLFSPDSQSIATGVDGGVVLTDIASGRELRKLPDADCAIAALPDGRILTASLGGARLALWGTSGDAPIASGPAPRIGCSGAAAGALLATTRADAIALTRLPGLENLVSLRALKDSDAGYVFTDDGFIDFVGPRAEDARAFPLCRIGAAAFPFEVCRERFEVPGLLEKVQTNDATYRLP